MGCQRNRGKIPCSSLRSQQAGYADRWPAAKRSRIARPTDERQTLIDKLQSTAKDLGATTVARHEFLRRSGVSERKIQRLFGSYAQASAVK